MRAEQVAEVDTIAFMVRHYSGAHVFHHWAASVYGRGHGHGAELVAEICKVSTLEAPYIASRLLVIAERDRLLKRFLREATPEQRFFDNHYHKGRIYAEADEPTQWAWVAGDALPAFLEVKQ